MYMLKFSRYDCPGCDRKWFFETIGEIEAFIKEAYPKFPVDEWLHGHEYYPNGLSIYECVGRNPVLKMRSMVEVHDFDYDMPECLCPEVATVAGLIFELQRIVDLMEEGEYQWPLDQITPHADKEDLVQAVFKPDRVVRMGGSEWLETV